jgi:hypothetical protein
MGLRSLLLRWTLLATAMLTGGCSKHHPAARADTATNTVQADSSAAATAAPPVERAPGPMVPPPSGAVITDIGDVNATLNQLSLELRRYVVGTRSVPKNFEDFVAKSHVQAPSPPTGKKYAIKDQAVVLVKR